MNRKLLFTTLALCLCAPSLIACDGEGGDGGALRPDGGEARASAGEPEDIARAATVWTEIQGYQSWAEYPGHEGIQPGGSPHGDFVRFYINDVAAGDPVGLPAGSIIIKENYADEAGTMLGAVTVMERIADYSPDSQDWWWVKYDPDGTVDVNPDGLALVGNVGGCVACHEGADGGDLVFVNDSATSADED